MYLAALDREIMQEEEAARQEQIDSMTEGFYSGLAKESGKAAR